MSRNPVWVLSLIALLGFAGARAATAPSPVPSAAADAPSDVVDTQLKNAVLGVAPGLSLTDTGQKKIFDEEVVPQYSLFISDYHREGQHVSAAVDLDGIRNTVRFSAAKNLNQPGAKILLSLLVDQHCQKCQDEAVVIRKIMQERVERRGFVPIWISADELAGQELGDLLSPHGAVGFLRVEMIPAPMDDEDAAHEDEKRYVSKARLEVRDVTRYSDQAEFFDTDTFETQTQKLLTHAFIELGAKADLAAVSAMNKDDLLIELSGIGPFSQYSRIKNEFQGKLKGLALLDERRISKGKAVFALKTKMTADEVKALLKGTLSGEDQAIQMEIR